MTTEVAFETVRVRDFRNLALVELDPVPRINVLSGDNGQGKTSLLEALYLLATSRSFRTERAAEMIRHGAEAASLRSSVREAGIVREQRVTLEPRARRVFLDGKKPESLARYAMKTPIVVFHPGDLTLVSGAAAGRRVLLDRIALFVDPMSADHRRRYEHAARSRQAALLARGAGAADLGAIEAVMARDGVALGRARAVATQHLTEALGPIFSGMAAPELRLECSFSPGGPLDEDALLEALARSRAVDRERRSAGQGPHRDDLDLRLDGRSVRRHASQGQQRILTLALKAAELDCLRRARGAEPVLLLDDVSSELDPSRTGAVYDFLSRTTGQVFATTTRPELFMVEGGARADRADFRLERGVLTRLA